MSQVVLPISTLARNRRRWFHFSLRILLLVVTVLCVWLGFKVNAARRQKEAVTATILDTDGTSGYISGAGNDFGTQTIDPNFTRRSGDLVHNT